MPKPLEIQITDPAGTRSIRVDVPAGDRLAHLGADEACLIRVSGELIAAIHAELFLDGEFWCVRDCASLSGTFIDDMRLFITPIRLENGQRIHLGRGNGAATIGVLSGAAAPRAGVHVKTVVASFVKEQKRERKRVPKKWKIAVPSIGVILIGLIWAGGAAVVAHRRAALLANPNLAQEEHDNGATERLAAIMSGEARPEDVDVGQIIKDASLGRGSSILSAVIDTVKPTANGSHFASPTPRAAVRAAPQVGASRGFTQDRTLPSLMAKRTNATDADRTSLDTEIEQESRRLTLERLRGMLDERQRLMTQALSQPLTSAEATRAAQVDQRLTAFGIDPNAMNWQPGQDEAALAAQLDPAVLESVRQRLLAAMSNR